VLRSLFEKEFEPELINFTMLLVDKDRTKYLPDISSEFAKLVDSKSNVINMTVVSAMPLEGYQLEKIRDKYKKTYNASAINLQTRLDSSLIGGIKIVIGDTVIDGTMRRRLEDLKKEILENRKYTR
jgi:F-type H+-transporting ATPase subunit delta